MTSARFFDASHQQNQGIDNQNPQYIENNDVPTIEQQPIDDQNNNEGDNQ
jgi:hypothetical protein